MEGYIPSTTAIDKVLFAAKQFADKNLFSMKENSIVVNTALGAVIAANAAVNHYRAHPESMAAFDVFAGQLYGQTPA